MGVNYCLTPADLEGLYTDISNLVSRDQSSISAAVSRDWTSLIEQTMETLEKALIDALKQKKDLDAVFKKMGLSGIEDFREKMNRYYTDSGFATQYSGDALQKIIDAYAEGNDEAQINRQIMLKAFSLWAKKGRQALKGEMSDMFLEKFNKQMGLASFKNTPELAKIVLGSLNIISGRQGNLTLTSTKAFGYYNVGNEGVPEIIAASATTPMKDTLDDLVTLFKSRKIITKADGRQIIQQAAKTSKKKNDSFKTKGIQNLSTKELDDAYLFLVNHIKFTPYVKKSKKKSVEGGILCHFDNAGYTWSFLTNSRPGSKAKYLNKNYIKFVNQQIIDDLSSRLATKDYIAEFKAALTHMVGHNELLFFIGGNTKNITGILAEAEAVAALQHVLNLRLDEAIQWVAEEGKGGKQLSIDIILKKLLKKNGLDYDIGIQVKGSTRTEEELPVSFAQLKTESFYERFAMSSDMVEAMTLGETALHFNVDYRTKTDGPSSVTYIEGLLPAPSGRKKRGLPPEVYEGQQKYLAAKENINELIGKIKMYLIQFMPQILYMEVDKIVDLDVLFAKINEDVTSAKGNLIYIVRGQVYFADEILQDIIDDLDLLRQLHIIGHDVGNNRFITSALAPIKREGKSTSGKPQYESVNILQWKLNHNSGPKGPMDIYGNSSRLHTHGTNYFRRY